MSLQIPPFCFRTCSLEDATKVQQKLPVQDSIVVQAMRWRYVPCKYRLYGPAAYIERLEMIIHGDEFEDYDHRAIIITICITVKPHLAVTLVKRSPTI